MINRRGANNPNWKGGKNLTTDKYIKVWRPGHPNSTSDGYILEHRLVMSKKLMRPLRENEVVHHKNHNKIDNRIGNLRLYKKRKHDRAEAQTRKRDVCGRFVRKETNGKH